MRRHLLLLVALALPACVVRYIDPDDDGPPPPSVHQAEPVTQPGQPPPPVAPAPAAMTREEAAHAALGYAQSQGYGARVDKVKWRQGRFWRVDLSVWRGDTRGTMRLEYEAWSRTIAHADMKVRGEHHRDDDDDDD